MIVACSPSPTRRAITAALMCLALNAHAQKDDPDAKAWQESAVNPPVSFSVDRLQTFPVAVESSLTYGIDPATLTVGEDGVVRYVLVARSSSGAINALYQGLRCQTGEVKTYGRWDNRSSWNINDKETWRPLSNSGFTRPAMVLAREGVCDGRTVNGNPRNILRALSTTKRANHGQ